MSRIFFCHFWLVWLWERGKGRQYSGEMKIKDLGTNLRILTQIDAEVAKKRNKERDLGMQFCSLAAISRTNWTVKLRFLTAEKDALSSASAPTSFLPGIYSAHKSRGTINPFSFLQVSYSRFCISRNYYTKTYNIQLCFNSFLMNLSTKLQRQAQAEASTWQHWSLCISLLIVIM